MRMSSAVRVVILSFFVAALGACAGAERASSAGAAAAPLSEIEQHALRSFDSAPERYFEIAADFGAAGARTGVAKDLQDVSLRGVQWNQPVVTVAFSGGDDKTYALIESTAMEWTRASRHFSLSFRDEAGQFRVWSASDRQPAADIRIAFRSGDGGGYWSLLGAWPNAPDRTNRP